MNQLKTYYQLTKPGILYANIMTAAAGFLFAADRDINLGLLGYLLAGTALIIASACVFNNYIDRNIDLKMARTKNRAIASGRVSGKNALTYASLLGVAGFALLGNTNALTFAIGALAIFSYVVLYGIAKRRTIHGTLVGTIPGSASIVAGYTAVTNQLDLAVLLLFIIMLSWQMAHFYSIAMFRISDYKAAKLPVMPVVVGARVTKIQIMIYVFAFVVACIDLSLFGYTGITYLLVVSAVGLYWLWKAINGFNARSDKKWARGMFGFSLVVLLVFSLMISIDSFLP